MRVLTWTFEISNTRCNVTSVIHVFLFAEIGFGMRCLMNESAERRLVYYVVICMFEIQSSSLSNSASVAEILKLSMFSYKFSSISDLHIGLLNYGSDGG